MTPNHLEQAWPEVLEAVDHFNKPPSVALEDICDLLGRHGAAVMSVMNGASVRQSAETFQEATLPRLYGNDKLHRALGAPGYQPKLPTGDGKSVMRLFIDVDRRSVVVDDALTIQRNGTADLLLILAVEFLKSAGDGLEPFDYRTISAKHLAERLNLSSDEVLRKRVSRSRAYLRRIFSSAGFDVDWANELIENLPWQGYRLVPDRVQVVRAQSTR